MHQLYDVTVLYKLAYFEAEGFVVQIFLILQLSFQLLDLCQVGITVHLLCFCKGLLILLALILLKVSVKLILLLQLSLLIFNVAHDDFFLLEVTLFFRGFFFFDEGTAGFTVLCLISAFLALLFHLGLTALS